MKKIKFDGGYLTIDTICYNCIKPTHTEITICRNKGANISRTLIKMENGGCGHEERGKKLMDKLKTKKQKAREITEHLDAIKELKKEF